MKEFLELVRRMIILIVILWAVFYFLIGIKMIPNDDMRPGLGAGDIALYYRLMDRPRARDVVVLKKNDTEYVGRVIACGGDKVEITDDSVLMVNDNMIVEEYIFSETSYYEGFVDYPVALKEDECFILCDKREGGEDSRYYGAVRYEEIEGVVIGIYRRNGI